MKLRTTTAKREREKTSLTGNRPCFFALAIIVSFNAFLFWKVWDDPISLSTTQVKKGHLNCDDPLNSLNQTEAGWVRPPVTYGHVHMAKTAGTVLNTHLVGKFERICGHKGCSYDGYQLDKRFNKSTGGVVSDVSNIPWQKDLVKKKYRGYDRGRVHPDIQDERGYEDCDYISMEIHSGWWIDTFSNWSLELHVPCRDPLDHLMSQCNHRGIPLDCNLPPNEAVKKCLLAMNRFDLRLSRVPNFHLKCFHYANLTQYFDYMGKILQPRRLQWTNQYRDTNMPRDRDSECLWKDPVLMASVREHMTTHFGYYKFCQSCLGSKDDLLQ